MFKHLKGKNGSTAFLPVERKMGGDVTYIKKKDAICLTEDQPKNIYKKVEQGNNLNIQTMKHDIEKEKN